MSEELNPGSIEEIIASNELAFRVEFSDKFLLGTNELYWRGAVLSTSNNLQWFKGEPEKAGAVKRQVSGPKLEYKVILEPTLSKIIYVYDGSTQILEGVNAIEVYDKNLFRKVLNEEQQFQYTAISFLNSKIPITKNEIDPESDYLQIPKLPPRTERWIADTAKKYKSTETRMKALQDFFSNPKFVYTLKPGKYRNMDDFLFLRREGFCEHFAGSYATLARALGIPARVVIGYQGGAYNVAGNFWKISQKDAHAWTEIAVNGYWVRVDPTQWVSPLRLNIGGEEFFSLSDEDQQLYSHTPRWKSDNQYGSFWSNAASIFENINYKWTLFLLNFDKQTQIDFLKDITSAWPTLLMIIILIVTLFFTLTKKRKLFKTSGLNPMNELMLFIEYKCRNSGIFIDPSYPPLYTLDQLEMLFEDQSKLIDRFRKEYENVVYNLSIPTKSAAAWKKEWVDFFKRKKLKEDTDSTIDVFP